MDPGFRVGIAGAGWPAWQHIRGYRKVEGVEVAALCDADPERLGRVSEEYGITDRYTDFGEMVERGRLHAVSVCTPNHLHAPMAVQAMKAGLHVLCEKPMAESAASARSMLDARDRTGRVLMIAHMLRFKPAARYLKERIRAGELGRVYFARAWWVRRSGIPGLGSWFTRKKLSGGGALIDIGVHVLDLALWFLGFPEPEAVLGVTADPFARRGKGVMAYGVPGKKGCDVEDFAAALVTFRGGGALSLRCSWASHVKDYDGGVELLGEEGGVRLGIDGDRMEWYCELGGVPADIRPRFPEVDPFEEETAHFVECVREGRPPLCTPEEGLRTLESIERIYASARKGRAEPSGG